MLQLIDVEKRVGAETHIGGVSLSLERGTLTVLLGATLSGKTSLMRLMAGLDKPTSGRILMDGIDVTGVSVRRRNVAMVYQQFINYPAMTVRENIASPLRVAGRSPGEIDAAVSRAARLMKLEPYLDRTPLNLSGGQQQRTALARAIVKGADLVLLDEGEDLVRRGVGHGDHAPPEFGPEIPLDLGGVVLEPRIHLSAIAPRSAPARLVGLQDHHVHPAPGEVERGGEAREAAAHHRDRSAVLSFQRGRGDRGPRRGGIEAARQRARRKGVHSRIIPEGSGSTWPSPHPGWRPTRPNRN